MTRPRPAKKPIVAALGGLLLLTAWLLRIAIADDAKAVATSRSRETDVAVALARNCLECHNTSDRKGGLDLTRREKASIGGDSGKALSLDDRDNSLLLKRIDAGEMPPKGRGKLSADERKLLSEWGNDRAI